MFALVLPDLGDAAVDRPYTYLIPPPLVESVAVGCRVLVPLGSRQVSGYVLEITSQPPAECDPSRVRPITAVRAPRPAFTAEQAALARWLADNYLCPLSEALRPCLAEAGGLSPKRRWQCADGPAVTALLPDPTLNAVLAYIRDHAGTSSTQIKHLFGDAGVLGLEALHRDGLIRPASGPQVKAREISAVFSALPPEGLLRAAEVLGTRAEKQAKLLQWAAAHLPGTDSFLALTVPEVAARAAVGDGAVRACIEKGYLCQERRALRRNPWESVEGRKATPPTLTDTQRHAFAAIVDAIRARTATSFLLLGVTGSGKTEVFLHAIEEVLAQRRQAIVLVPEISLTAQAMALYHGRFPNKVAVLHSHLSSGERFDEWQRIASGEARVVLGARSAIFAPCPEVGLIIIDEEHESSYKQENSPRYHAKAVALQRGALCGAPVVLASATPSLESMREAELGVHTLLRLPERIAARPLPPVKLIDLRQMTASAQILSFPLRQAIARRLANKEQTILFLNRRGYAHTLLCRECGHQESCPNCAVPLTYHMRSRMLRCHYCDFQKGATVTCPDCKGTRIAYRGVGTERLEEEVAKVWPEARIGRMDRDTTAHKGAHREILDRFGREETDILIGTQMVAKGFDFPKVTLVGVIAADTSLGVPDFRAPERTFQLLTQVAGRAGRAQWAGEVFVQTFRTEHYAIRLAAEHDYEGFYRQELIARGESEACWPPLTAVINVVVSGPSESEVKATAAALAHRAREDGGARMTLPTPERHAILPGLLDIVHTGEPDDEDEEDFPGVEELLHREVPDGIRVEGPSPCPLERLQGNYRYHVVLRGQDRAALCRMAKGLQEINAPRGVHVVIDVDPLSMA